MPHDNQIANPADAPSCLLAPYPRVVLRPPLQRYRDINAINFLQEEENMMSSSVGICKEICLITVGLTEANVATVLADWLY